jgi:hypothetical protein
MEIIELGCIREGSRLLLLLLLGLTSASPKRQSSTWLGG